MKRLEEQIKLFNLVLRKFGESHRNLKASWRLVLSKEKSAVEVNSPREFFPNPLRRPLKDSKKPECITCVKLKKFALNFFKKKLFVRHLKGFAAWIAAANTLIVEKTKFDSRFPSFIQKANKQITSRKIFRKKPPQFTRLRGSSRDGRNELFAFFSSPPPFLLFSLSVNPVSRFSSLFFALRHIFWFYL